MSSRKRTPDKESTENHHRSRRAAGTRKQSRKARASPKGLGKGKWVAPADPFGIATDNLAGVRLFESRQDRQMARLWARS